jgi:formylglycine-generating enzyme required for sulfatase activity
MSFIPAGSFTMGNTFPSDSLGEVPLHTVYVSRFTWIGAR